MKKYTRLCTVTLFLWMAFLLAANGLRRRDEALAAILAPEVLRFHVLANSDSPEDQALKLLVKDFLLETLRPHVTSKEEAQDYIMQNQAELEEETEQFITDLGFSYPAEIRLETCGFPRRIYGDTVYPAGTYDAVRVLIGDGVGENFWCVLYPTLGIPEHAIEAKKTEQETVLPRITVRFQLIDFFKKDW